MTLARFLIAPGEGPVVASGAVGAILKLAGDRMGGHLAVVEHPIAPGALVPPHTHNREDELSYVVTGEIGARVGDEILTAPAGSYVLKPRGVPHAFWNAGRQSARIIEFIFPAGFERFFGELADLAATGRLDRASHARLGGRYGVRYHFEWIAELTERYGVRVLP